MNKKLLFATMSLAALAACTTDDFESNVVAEGTSPVKFEVINDNDALTRASMDGNTIVWNANDGDLFTLYHGGALAVAGENATYKAVANPEGTATLSTPAMIKEGDAIMVWPVDSQFTIKPGDNLTVRIPAELDNIENSIPYVSDLVEIGAYTDKAKYNTAGLDRKYPVFMRPMASQLIVKSDYAGTDAKIAELEAGEDGIEPIKVTSIDLESPSYPFTTEIQLAFSGAVGTNWTTVKNNAWKQVTEFGAPTVTTTELTTTVLDGNAGCKFLILPQTIAAGSNDEAVVVNTIYGKVEVSAANYGATDIKDAWYRFIGKDSAPAAGETKATKAETSGENKDKYKTTANIEDGMVQTIGGFSIYKATKGVAKGEPVGAAATRYVKVLLTKLDMSDLHIKTDKQLRDAAKVWDKMGLADVTVYLDGDKNKEFAMSQTTIKTINDINKKYTSKSFKVMPCDVAKEQCETIVITEGGDIQDMAFIKIGPSWMADVVFNAGETWNWKGTVKVGYYDVDYLINKGTMVNASNATLKTAEADGSQNYMYLINEGTWNITGGTLFVQFHVYNDKNLNISKGAEYRQDGTTFVNEAFAKPSRFGGDDSKIGKVENKGVFATVGGGNILNLGLIEHADVNAKTYITSNQLVGDFSSPFVEWGNQIGRINLPYSNKDEDNVSITNTTDNGFVSVTVDGEVTGALNASVLGNKVNYVIIKSGITQINKVAGSVKYLEINQPGTEIAWKVSETKEYEGLMVLSNVNITQGTTVKVNKATYLKGTMYVGGSFTEGSWSGYYGDTNAAFPTNYVTY